MSSTESEILRKYYTEHDFVLSPEGILKVISVIVCIVSAVLFLSAAGPAACGAASGLATSGATVAIASAVAMALLYAGALCSVPLLAPLTWLYVDIVVSTVLGVLLLVSAILSMTLCRLSTVVDYLHGPLGVTNAAMVTGSAVITYVAVMRLWDGARPAVEPRRPAPLEQDA